MSAAIVRIAIAVTVLLTLARLTNPVSTGDVPGAHTLYRPVGIWMLLGHTPPPSIVVTLLWVLAWSGTIAMLLGAATRASTAISFFASVALASLSFAASHTWSHQYNVVFLAQLAFLGARGGDTLSVDAVIRKLRKQSPMIVARGYQWSLRLVQLAVALMFAGAAFHKILHGHFTLRWALSDNLRHHLLVQFDLAGLQRPPLVDWLIDDPWRYRTAALLNLISQATPVLACVFVRRPVLRALCGLAFVGETIALGFVVDLWNLHWLPLFAVFVDRDALIAWLARRPQRHPEAPASWRASRKIRAFIVAFVIYDAITAFVPGIDQWLNTYPFSGFPMFSTIRVHAPYGEHQAYAVAGDHFEVTSDQPIDLAIQRWFDHSNRGIATVVHDPAQLRVRLAAVLAQAHRRYPAFGIHAIRLDLTIFEAPAYPAPAHFEPHNVGVVGELDDAGVFRTMLGTLDDTGVELAARNVDASSARLGYYRDDDPQLIALDAERTGDRFRFPALVGDPLYVVAITPEGTAWLVATRAEWHWQ